MMASWKIFAFAGGVALAGAVGAACTVTTNSDDDAGDLFNDDAGDQGDAGIAVDTGSPCVVETLPDGGSTNVSLDQPGSGSTACTDCTATNCCSTLTPCFQDPAGQCQALEACIQNQCLDVTPADAGSCIQDCSDLYPDGVPLHNAWSDCQSNGCASACPQ